MEAGRAIELLRLRTSELEGLAAGRTWGDRQFERWYHQTDRTLRHIFSDDHKLVSDFTEVQWGGTQVGSTVEASFDGDRASAAAVLEAAVYDLEALAQAPTYADSAGIDPELWDHVEHLIEQAKWSQLASEASIFAESRIRKWSGRPASETGIALMNAVFRPGGGVFQLGRTDGEIEGWHALARGLIGAVRNVDTHHIQERDDSRRYALGVLGLVSLLIIQLRYEHGTHFRG